MSFLKPDLFNEKELKKLRKEVIYYSKEGNKELLGDSGEEVIITNELIISLHDEESSDGFRNIIGRLLKKDDEYYIITISEVSAIDDSGVQYDDFIGGVFSTIYVGASKEKEATFDNFNEESETVRLFFNLEHGLENQGGIGSREDLHQTLLIFEINLSN